MTFLISRKLRLSVHPGNPCLSAYTVPPGLVVLPSLPPQGPHGRRWALRKDSKPTETGPAGRPTRTPRPRTKDGVCRESVPKVSGGPHGRGRLLPPAQPCRRPGKARLGLRALRVPGGRGLRSPSQRRHRSCPLEQSSVLRGSLCFPSPPTFYYEDFQTPRQVERIVCDHTHTRL